MLRITCYFQKKKSKNVIFLVSLVLIALTGLVFLGRIIIKKVKDKVTSAIITKTLSKDIKGEIKVEDGGKKISYKGEEGEFTFEEEGSLPEDFPKDFPIYPGSKLTTKWSSGGEDGKGLSLMWETEDSLEKVNLFFKDELPKKGWKILSAFEEEDSKAYSFEKDSFEGLLGIGKNEGKIDISISIGEK